MEAPEAAVAPGVGEYPEEEEEAYPCKGCGEVSFGDSFPERTLGD